MLYINIDSNTTVCKKICAILYWNSYMHHHNLLNHITVVSQTETAMNRIILVFVFTPDVFNLTCLRSLSQRRNILCRIFQRWSKIYEKSLNR